jgi:hypothetical protein
MKNDDRLARIICILNFVGSEETEAGQLTESIKFQLHEGLMCRYCYLFRFYSKTSKTDPTEAAE